MIRVRSFSALDRIIVVIAAAVWLFAASPAVRAQETTFAFDPAATKVSFTLGATLHTVHGTMKLKSGEIRFDPRTGAAGGTVVVDATSAETGNQSRDSKMHREVLQSARYPEIVFTAERVTGTLQSSGSSQVELAGTFELAGGMHPTTLAVTISRDASGPDVHARTTFAVPYVAWGLKNPSTLFLRVSDHVDMAIDAAGHLKQGD